MISHGPESDALGLRRRGCLAIELRSPLSSSVSSPSIEEREDSKVIEFTRLPLTMDQLVLQLHGGLVSESMAFYSLPVFLLYWNFFEMSFLFFGRRFLITIIVGFVDRFIYTTEKPTRGSKNLVILSHIHLWVCEIDVVYLVLIVVFHFMSFISNSFS